jgi:3-hydroxyacyl-CoA dehydrogenase
LCVVQKQKPLTKFFVEKSEFSLNSSIFAAHCKTPVCFYVFYKNNLNHIMLKRIHKVAVLGSGLMGTGIAAHLAGCGLEVLMLDILPPDLSEADDKKPAARNRIGNNALQTALKAKPAPFYDNNFASRITVGNFEDDMSKIADADWIVEVVVERLDVKKQVFEKVDKLRRKGSLVTSNTSGIPINLMAEGRSDDFRAHFCGTHFFNPARYMRLLEIIPTADTSAEVVDFFMHFGDKILGKQTVLCKDTPAFIANRVGCPHRSGHRKAQNRNFSSRRPGRYGYRRSCDQRHA